MDLSSRGGGWVFVKLKKGDLRIESKVELMLVLGWVEKSRISEEEDYCWCVYALK